MSFPSREMRFITALESVISRQLQDEEIPVAINLLDMGCPLTLALFVLRINGLLKEEGINNR
jgi:hypothetical protein